MTCGANMEYKACADPCVPTCSDEKAENCGDLGPCTEGCFCKDGYVFDNAGKCIETEKCGCLYKEQGVYVKVKNNQYLSVSVLCALRLSFGFDAFMGSGY